MILLALAACSPPIIGDDFSPTWALFPFDGQRTWVYRSADPLVPYRLVSTSSGEPELRGELHVYRVETTVRCDAPGEDCADGALAHAMLWSSDRVRGVQVHGTDQQDYVPPVQIVPADGMLRGASIETEVDGVRWTSTFLGIEACPLAMSAEWDACRAFRVEAEGLLEGLLEGFPLAGTWWVTLGNGIVAFQREGEAHAWELLEIDCEPMEDCDGTW